MAHIRAEIEKLTSEKVMSVTDVISESDVIGGSDVICESYITYYNFLCR
jgi:hypothetical protein